MAQQQTKDDVTDADEFGFRAEIGISTDKLHARGPMGLEEVTTYKYVIPRRRPGAELTDDGERGIPGSIGRWPVGDGDPPS